MFVVVRLATAGMRSKRKTRSADARACESSDGSVFYPGSVIFSTNRSSVCPDLVCRSPRIEMLTAQFLRFIIRVRTAGTISRAIVKVSRHVVTSFDVPAARRTPIDGQTVRHKRLSVAVSSHWNCQSAGTVSTGVFVRTLTAHDAGFGNLAKGFWAGRKG